MNCKQQTYQDLRVVISGGGTGGHVFPAIAIAAAIRHKIPEARILFVGALGRMEMERVPQAGFHIIGLDIMGLQRRLTLKNLLLPGKLIKSLAGARQIVKRFRPDVAIGVGGYASGPLIWAAARNRVPVLIQEQNSYPGITNRLLGRRADRICVAYTGMERYFPAEKLFLTGNPVRHDLLRAEGKREAGLRYFGMQEDKPVLFVTGGSLGARSINQGISNNLNLLASKGVQIIWQTGKAFYEEAKRQGAEQQGARVYVSAFIDRMDYAYAAADMVVSRAGAIAVSEISTLQKPAILVPSPHVAEDHQTKNAMALVNHHAAILVQDGETKEKLGEAVLSVLFDKERQHRLRERLAGLSYRDAADRIAGAALELVKQ